jgi:hypothetical protein
MGRAYDNMMCTLCLVLQVFAEKKGLSIFKDKV